MRELLHDPRDNASAKSQPIHPPHKKHEILQHQLHPPESRSMPIHKRLNQFKIPESLSRSIPLHLFLQLHIAQWAGHQVRPRTFRTRTLNRCQQRFSRRPSAFRPLRTPRPHQPQSQAQLPPFPQDMQQSIFILQRMTLADHRKLCLPLMIKPISPISPGNAFLQESQFFAVILRRVALAKACKWRLCRGPALVSRRMSSLRW